MTLEFSRDHYLKVQYAELKQNEFVTNCLSLFSEPGSSLGIGLGGSNSSTKLQGIFVQCIIEGSPAANDGRLR